MEVQRDRDDLPSSDCNAMKIVLHDFDLTSFLWRETPPAAWAYFITGIDRRLTAIDPKAKVEHHGPGRVSGCTWGLLVDAAGCGLSEWTDDWPEGTEQWEIALSYRGPLITALSWKAYREPEDAVTSPRLVALARDIASQFHLNYLDAHELQNLEIPWDELQGDANMRLDWSDMPNAFNLLFYEY
jgi:hypothetical protein